MLKSRMTMSRLSLFAFPPLYLGDVRKLPDKAVTYLKLLMLLHLDRECPPGANRNLAVSNIIESVNVYKPMEDLLSNCIVAFICHVTCPRTCFLSNGAWIAFFCILQLLLQGKCLIEIWWIIEAHN